MSEASVLMQGMVQQGQMDPTEVEAQLHTRTTETMSVAEESKAPPVEGAVAVEVPPEEEDTASTPSDFDPERWTQGTVAPQLSIKKQ